MSIVAWDGKILAADKMIIYGDISYISKKIFQLEDGTLAAFTGGIEHGLLLVDWYKNNKSKEEFPSAKDFLDKEATLVIIKNCRELFYYESTGIPIPILAPFCAWGTGSPLALGAMAVGANAVEAVEITSKYNVYCGNGVDWYRANP